MKIGSPKQQGTQGSNTKNYFKIQKGTNVYRILPPMGDLADAGIWSRYYSVHYGYRNLENKMFVFQSPEVVNRKTKMVEVEDPAKVKIDRLNTKRMQIEEKLKTSPSSQLTLALEQVKEELKVYNLEKANYVNAIDSDGRIGLLKIKHKEMLQFKSLRDRLIAEEGIDPVGAEGAYIQFDKSGTGRDTVVTVSLAMDKVVIDGKRVSTPRLHTIDESLIPKLESSFFDLDNLFVKPTSQEVQEMVEGGPIAVSKIMGKYRPLKSQTTKQEAAPEQEMLIDESEEELLEEAPPVKQASTVQASSPKSSTPQTNVESDDDFLASIGVFQK